MKHLFLFFSFVLFFSIGCKKKDLSFEFEGIVQSSNTGQTMKDVKIKAYAYTIGDNSKTLEGSTVTDADGKYSLEVKRGKYKKVVIELSKNKYFTHSKPFFFDDLSTEDVTPFNSTLSPQSWTRFIIKNIYSQQSSDELKFQKVSGKTDCSNCCPNTTTFYNGVIDTVIVCPNDGGTNMEFYYWVNGNNPTGEKNSVYNAPFDTVDYNITY